MTEEKIKRCFCGRLIKEHPRCDACGIYTGQSHLGYASHFRGYNLCGSCIDMWKTRDRLAGKEIKWKEVIHWSK